MNKMTTVCAALLVLAGCATAKREAFDPAADPRVGAEVKRACFSSTASSSGGYIRVGDRDAFVTGTMREKYLLMFSPGCGSIGPSGSFPIFRDYGDSCRRRGELVEIGTSGFGVTGSCTIQKIYEWDPDAEEDTDESGEAAL